MKWDEVRAANARLTVRRGGMVMEEERTWSVSTRADEAFVDGWREMPLEVADAPLPLDAGMSVESGESGRRRRWRTGLAVLAAFVLGLATMVVLLPHGLASTPGQAAFNGALSVGAVDTTRGAGAGSAVGAAVVSPSGAIGDNIQVDVQGDVRHPGVYTLASNARVEDAVRVAGGVLHAADASAINEAAPVDDGAEIVIPFVHTNGQVAPTGSDTTTGEPAPSAATGMGAVTPPTTGTAAGAAGTTGAAGITEATGAAIQRIDLNTASVATLETLPDIGPSRAEAIVSYRQAHGPFASVAGLRSVHGIGPVIYGRIAPLLYVGQ